MALVTPNGIIADWEAILGDPFTDDNDRVIWETEDQTQGRLALCMLARLLMTVLDLRPLQPATLFQLTELTGARQHTLIITR